MTAAVYLTVAVGALTGSPATAMGIAVLFGLTRGLAILLGLRLTDPDRLRSFHRRFEAAGPAVRWAVIVVQLAVAVTAAAGAFGWPGAAVAAALAAAAVLVTRGAAPAPAARPGALLSSR
jgi:hypothetical protein